MNYEQLIVATLKNIDEYSRKGNPAAPSKTVDYRLKIPEATNGILMNLASTTGKLPAEWEIINFPVLNESTRDTSTIKNHIPGTDDIIATLPGARSYFLEVTGHYHIVIEEKIDDWWGVLADMQPLPGSEPTTFTEVKGLLTPSSTSAPVRIRLTGDYIYPYRHHILYPYSFPSDAEVQQNRAWFEYPLPADWLKFNNVMIRRDTRQWVPFAEYKITPTHFAYNRYATGEIIVNYWRRPKAIVVADPKKPTAEELAQVIDAMPDATEIVPLGVAGTILVGDDNNASSYLLQLYNNGKFELTQNEGNYGLQSVTNINGW
jgi:hypothetical protein